MDNWKVNANKFVKYVNYLYMKREELTESATTFFSLTCDSEDGIL